MYMNMKSITPVNESFKYVLKNLYDGFIEGSNASVKNYVAMQFLIWKNRLQGII